MIPDKRHRFAGVGWQIITCRPAQPGSSARITAYIEHGPKVFSRYPAIVVVEIVSFHWVYPGIMKHGRTYAEPLRARIFGREDA